MNLNCVRNYWRSGDNRILITRTNHARALIQYDCNTTIQYMQFDCSLNFHSMSFVLRMDIALCMCVSSRLRPIHIMQLNRGILGAIEKGAVEFQWNPLFSRALTASFIIIYEYILYEFLFNSIKKTTRTIKCLRNGRLNLQFFSSSEVLQNFPRTIIKWTHIRLLSSFPFCLFIQRINGWKFMIIMRLIAIRWMMILRLDKKHYSQNIYTTSEWILFYE